MKIVVLDGYALSAGDVPWTELQRCGDLTVHDRTPVASVFERALPADILITNKTTLSGDLIGDLNQLKFISVLATGYDVVDVAAARRRGIPVSNVPVYGTDTVAQYVIALILELCHHVGDHARSVLHGDWTTSPDWTYWLSPQVELRELTLGIVGYGRIGQRVAELAHAFGMKILYASLAEKNTGHIAAVRVSVEELFSKSDIVSLHCTLSESNSGFVNRPLLERMKHNAFLINTARGQLVNQRDLSEALKRGTLAGAALDVLSKEPPEPSDPLLSAPHCIITPHIAWASLPARRRIMQTTVENVKAFLHGIPIHVVNSVSNAHW